MLGSNITVFICDIPTVKYVATFACGNVVVKVRDTNLIIKNGVFGCAVKSTAVRNEGYVIYVDVNDSLKRAYLLFSCNVVVCTGKCAAAWSIAAIDNDCCGVAVKLGCIRYVCACFIGCGDNCAVCSFKGNYLKTVGVRSVLICNCLPYGVSTNANAVCIKCDTLIGVVMLGNMVPEYIFSGNAYRVAPCSYLNVYCNGFKVC